MSLRSRLLIALPFSKNELQLLIASAPIRYKEYKIPKKSPGKMREVSQPTPEVKLLQRWIIENELNHFPVHHAAKAYKNEVGLIKNVEPHKNNRFLLKIDFKDFFPSISSIDLLKFLKNEKFNEQDLNDLSQILFKSHHPTKSLRLAIGAPSSPFLSNILMYSLDEQIENECKNLGITYTRYADDLSFSTNTPKILSLFEVSLSSIIENYTLLRLSINTQKTIHTSKKNGRKITGLIITSQNNISIGRERKMLLRAQIDYFIKGKLTPDEVESLKGYIAFLKSVEPSQVQRLKDKYGELVMSSLKH